jgi:sucrose-6-phosphate hydrolase SacC (GH32 family)
LKGEHMPQSLLRLTFGKKDMGTSATFFWAISLALGGALAKLSLLGSPAGQHPAPTAARVLNAPAPKETALLPPDTTYREAYRPQYHFTPPTSSMGDPSGLVYDHGIYHLYYWRHATSPDLVHWSHKPVAFQRNDSLAQMSGSVVLDEQNTSGFGTKENPPYVAVYSVLRPRDGRQMQAIAYSTDRGRSYTAYQHNPILDIGSTEFRDPQVFWHQESKQWVMVIALAADRKVRFYGSPDLKDWTFLSDFGPVGAVNGVWECPDLFSLPLDTNPARRKWVLVVDVQPVSGQYFLGEFDGKKFTLDPAYARQLAIPAYEPTGTVLFDFEHGLGQWQLTGDAFAESPAQGTIGTQSVIIGYKGKYLVNTFHHDDAGTGRALSPPFTIGKNYLNFLIGGGNQPTNLALNLLVDNKVVRTSTGPNTETMFWENWHVADLKGKTARLEIVDDYTGGFGHINVDHIMQADEPAKQQRPSAFWLDYGSDFYAVRSWQNAPQNKDSRVWIAWMGNWLYSGDAPTTPWKGMQSVPRTLALRTFAEGVRLVQKPLKNLKQLRQTHFQAQHLAVAATKPLAGFQPRTNSYELIVEYALGSSKEFGLNLAVGGRHKTTIGYNVAKQTLYVDRRHSGDVSFSPAFPTITEAQLAPVNKKIKLRIFVDQSSVEVFADGGKTVLTNLIFPAATDTKIELFSTNGTATVTALDAWQMGSIWPSANQPKQTN